jgi:hypothetical protein
VRRRRARRSARRRCSRRRTARPPSSAARRCLLLPLEAHASHMPSTRHKQLYVYMYVYICIYVHTYIHTHTLTHTLTFTYALSLSLSLSHSHTHSQAAEEHSRRLAHELSQVQQQEADSRSTAGARLSEAAGVGGGGCPDEFVTMLRQRAEDAEYEKKMLEKQVWRCCCYVYIYL